MTALENLVRLYRYLHDRLKFLQPSVDLLIEQAESSQEFSDIGILQECGKKMRDGKSFSASWCESVYEVYTEFDNRDIDIIVNISNTLGLTDIDSQLAVLEYDRERLALNLDEARDYAAKHKKMYRSLGTLAGILIAIFVA